MADRVHPTPLLPLSSPPPTPPPAGPHHDSAPETAPLTFQGPPPQQQQQPRATSYIVRVPKDQVLRVPPPDRASRYRKLAARPARGRLLRRACCGACCALLALLVLAAAFVGVVYLVYRPRAPSFSVASLSITGGLEAAAAARAPSSPVDVQLDAAVRADNGANRKVGVDYRGGGEVTISYSGVQVATGKWPAFHQPPRNVTLVSLPLAGTGVAFTDEQRKRLAAEQAAGAVPLTVEARVPVQVRFGKVLRTWTVDVKARCELTVDKLAGEAAAKNNAGCRVKVRPLWWWW